MLNNVQVYPWTLKSMFTILIISTVKCEQREYNCKKNSTCTQPSAKLSNCWATIIISFICYCFDSTYPKKIKLCHCFRLRWKCTAGQEWRTSQSIDVFGPRGSGGAALAVCDKRGPCDPWEFPPAVLLLNNPGHTIAGEPIIAHERTEEEMRGRQGLDTHTDIWMRAKLTFSCLSASLSLSKLPSDWMTVW